MPPRFHRRILRLAIAGLSAQGHHIEVLPRYRRGAFRCAFRRLKEKCRSAVGTEKKAGLIDDYSLFLNQTSSGSNDWDIGFTITYKNMAPLDGLPDKVYELRMKQYGSKEDERKVIEKRVENAKVVSTNLLRDITL